MGWTWIKDAPCPVCMDGCTSCDWTGYADKQVYIPSSEEYAQWEEERQEKQDAAMREAEALRRKEGWRDALLFPVLFPAAVLASLVAFVVLMMVIALGGSEFVTGRF